MNNPFHFHTDAFRIVFRLAGLAAVFFGVYIWLFPSAPSTGAFALYGAVPAWALGLPLIVGGLGQFVGCCLYHRAFAASGATLALGIFLTAEYSCLRMHPSTGVPAYGLITGIWLAFLYCIWCVPLPCATKPNGPLSHGP